MHDKGSMNRCYRLVWNALSGVWQVAPETAKGRGKSRMGRRVRPMALLPLAAALASAGATASPQLPGAAQVVAGSGSISRSASEVQVKQTSDRMAIDWQSFSIGVGQRVEFVQPSAGAVALNRVVGADPSVIQGQLRANGHVFLLNPNGVLFTPTAQVQVGALTASTLGVDTAEFMAGGRFTLRGSSREAVVNEGRIATTTGGSVTMVAARILNSGQIDAPRGQVLMGAGSQVTLDLGGPVKLQVSQAALEALIDNGGAIRADGGLIYLQARAAGELMRTVINQTGTVEARTLATGEQGQIYLLGDMATGRIDIGGRLDASAPQGGNGGFIETSGAIVDVRPSVEITTAAAQGRTGDWLVDPFNITVAASGGNITGATLSTALNSNNVTLDTTYATYGTGSAASGTSYPGGAPGSGVGNIRINDAVTKTGGTGAGTTLTLKAHRDIEINQPVTSTGGRLNLVLVADQMNAGAGNVSFGASGRVVTNGGNFYVGNVSGTYDETLAPTAQHFSMATGSYVDVGTGNLNIAVKGNISLPNNNGQEVTYALRAVYNEGQRHFNNSSPSIIYGNYGQFIGLSSTNGSTTSGRVVGGSSAGSITTANSNASVADIVTGVDLRINAGSIGSPSAPLRLSGPADPYGLVDNPTNSSKTFNTIARTLTVTNTAGSSHLSEVGIQIMGTAEFTVGSQANATQRMDILGDNGGRGHIRLNTDGSGVLALATGDINTSGVPGIAGSMNSTPQGTDPSVFPTSVSITAPNIRFANGSVDVGNSVQYYWYGAGTARKSLGMGPYSASFSALATTSMAGTNANGAADLTGRSISLRGPQLGTAAGPVEVAGVSELSLDNTGGSTYVKVTDNSASDIAIMTTKTTGSHHVLWSGGDHINFSTTTNGAYVPTISGGASDGATFGSTQGIELTRGSRQFSWLLNSGVLEFDTLSTNLGAGSFQVTVSSTNSDRVAGKSVFATNPVDGQAEITAGDVKISVFSTAQAPAAVTGLEFAKGGNSNTNTLEVSTYAGNVSIRELTPGHFKTIDLTLSGEPVTQSIAVDLAGADDLAIADNGTQVLLDATRVNLREHNRNFSFSGSARKVQIDGTAVGSGTYNINAGRGIALNGDVLTNGGAITLSGGGTGAGSGLTLMRSVRIDSNADDAANSASTGTAGSITLWGALSATAAGHDLVVDSGSGTAAGATLRITSSAGNTSGAFLRDLTLSSKGSTNQNDGSLMVQGSSLLLARHFSATGDTTLLTSNLTIDTEQGNTGDAGDIRFAGKDLRFNQAGNFTFNTSTNAAGGQGGDVDLAGTVVRSSTAANGLTINARGGIGGSGGEVSLPAIGITGTAQSLAKTVSGGTLTLYGNLGTHRADLTLNGDVRLASNVTLDTYSTTSTGAAGALTINGSLGGTAAGRTLTINTDSPSGAGGAVTLNVGGSAPLPLSVLLATATGSTAATAGSISLTGLQTTQSQRLIGGSISLNGQIGTGTLVLNGGNQSTSVTGAGQITANAVAVSGTGNTVTLDAGSGHRIGTLAASGVGSLSVLNNDVDLTIGTANAVSGISATGPVSLATRTGDIVLSQNISTTSASNSAVVLNAGRDAAPGQASGGNIRRTGSASISTGANGRYTLYTGSLDDSTSLTALVPTASGRFRYNSDESASNFSSPLGTGGHVIYREQPTISLSTSGGSKTYDGQVFNSASPTWSASGLRNGDTTSSLTGTARYAGTAVGAVDAGSYTLTIAGLSSTLGYAVDSPASTYTIAKAPLTVTTNDARKTYDGLPFSGGDGVSYSGFVGHDNAANSLTGSLAFGGTAQGAVNVGTYVLTSSGLSAVNYELSYLPGSLSVSKAPLTVQANSLVKTYDRQAFSGGNGVTYSGFVNGETAASLGGSLSFGGTAQGAVNAGDYTIVPAGLSSDNYALTFAPGALTVTPAPLTVTAHDARKVYDTRAYSGGNGVSYSGFVSGDDVANSLAGTLVYRGSAQGAVNAGSYAIVPSGQSASNYAVTYLPGTLTVEQAPLTVTARDAAKVYDTQAFTRGNGVDYTGFVGDDTAASSLTGSLAYGGSAIGAVNAGTYELAPTGLASANYRLTFASGTLTVAKAPLTVTADDVTKVYDARGFSSGTGVRYSGFVGSDTEANSLGGRLVYGGDAQGAVNAGTYGLTVSGLNADNYALRYVDGTLRIDPAPLTVTALDARKVYDAQPFTGGSGVRYTGFVGNDTAASSLGGSLAYGGSAVGAIAAGEHVISVSGLTARNYTLAYAPGTLTVDRAPLTITANDVRKVYDTEAFRGGNGVRYAGFAAGDDAANSLQGTLAYGGSAQGAVRAGSYVITVGGLRAANYDLSFASGQLTVDKAPLTVTANSVVKEYDGLLFSGGNGVVFAGLLGRDGPDNLNGQLVYGGTAQGALNAGDYSIVPGGLASLDYEIRFVDGNLRINGKPVQVTTAIARSEALSPSVPAGSAPLAPVAGPTGLQVVHVNLPPASNAGPQSAQPGEGTPAGGGRSGPSDAELRALAQSAGSSGAPRLVVIGGGIQVPASLSASPSPTVSGGATKKD